MKFILPVICAIIFIFVLNALNPARETGGIVMMAMIGVGVGALLNSIVFKKKPSEE